ncbi:DUF6038 family protein [Corticicoccus populi]|uniref:DUF6038 family protein n=1 Tax=Corticicoccus populi TaxID=1812821 RepID=A0ABW5WXJ1_9STAP
MNLLNESYTGKYIQDRLKITPKIFSQNVNKLWVLYGLDLTLYQVEAGSKSANYRFNKYEAELLIVLMNGLKTAPFKVTESKMSDEEYRIKNRDNNPDSFIKFIENVVQAIDDIEDQPLKAYIYANKIYDETLEFLSARKKLEDSFSMFIQYTGSLDPIESAKRHRELAYRIDEMIFELLDEGPEPEIIKTKYMNFDLHPNFTDLEQTYKRFEYYKQQDSTNRYNHSTDDQLLDWFIVNTLSKMREGREDEKEIIQKQIKEMKDKKKKAGIPRLIEFSNFWEINDPVSMKIEDEHYENLDKIQDAVNSYNVNLYKTMDYIKKIEIIKDDNMTLENHEYFKPTFNEFYKTFKKMVLLMQVNRTRFIKDGVSPILLDYFMRDTNRVFEIMQNYGIAESSHNQKDVSTIISLYKEFLRITQSFKDNNHIQKSSENITSWNFAYKMLDNLKSLNKK